MYTQSNWIMKDEVIIGFVTIHLCVIGEQAKERRPEDRV